jgi:Protein of unknown function (DUF434)
MRTSLRSQRSGERRMPRRSARRRAGSRRQRRGEPTTRQANLSPVARHQTHRGLAPQDERLFAVRQLPALRAAAADLCWLLDHDYAPRSAIELVGNRYNLTSRQRMAVATSDGIMLDHCQRWANLARLIIADRLPQTRLFDLASRED